MDPLAEKTIEEALEDCRVRIGHGEAIAACLDRYPRYASELGDLLPLVQQLPGLTTDPDPTAAQQSRERFRSRITTRSAARVRNRRAGLRRFALTACLAFLLAFSGTQLVQASSAALPDSPLYPVAQAREGISGLLARTPEQQTALQLHIGQQRLQNLQRANSDGKSYTVKATLARAMVLATANAVRRIPQAPGTERSRLTRNARSLILAEEAVLGENTMRTDPRLRRISETLTRQLQDLNGTLDSGRPDSPQPTLR